MKIINSVQKTDSLTYEQQNNDQITRQILPGTNVEINRETDRETNKQPNKEDVEKAAEKLNETVRIFNKRFRFSVHEDTHRVVVKVIDTTTDKIINEIPPEKVLNIITSMDNLLGIIVDEKL